MDGYAVPAYGLLRNVNDSKHLVSVRLKANGFVREKYVNEYSLIIQQLFRLEGNEAETKDNNKKSRGNLHNRRVLCTDSIIRIQLCDSRQYM